MNRKQFFVLTEKIISQLYPKEILFNSRIHHEMIYNSTGSEEIDIRFYLTNYVVILKIKSINFVIEEVEYYRYWIYQCSIKLVPGSCSVCINSKHLSILIGEKLERDVFEIGYES